MSYKNNISKAAMKEIKQIMDKVNKEEQIQSKIHDDINFWKNTINLLIGKRGSGKTFNVNYEMVKLGYIVNNGGYTCFIIISDKTMTTLLMRC
jgi:signal recognition particle GTPase